MPAPIISVAQMREWEQLTWDAGRTPMQVISRVGHTITAWARQRTRAGDAILVLAGKGHNGDDARQVAQILTDREVNLITIRDPVTGLKEFQAALSLPLALIIEGLFGIGLKGNFDAPWSRLIRAINESRVPILSVDVPAGLHADTGEIMGTAIRATCTLTLGAPKRGLLTAAARPYVGRLELAPDIGLVPCPHKSPLLWSLPEDFQGFPPPRPADSHKGDYGHLVIVAGSRGYHGAAVLAAQAALRARPGLVTLITPEDVYVPVAAQLRAAMVRPWNGKMELPESCSTVLFGPGLASPAMPAEMKPQLLELWRHAAVPVVVDASGLDWLPSGRIASSALRVMTPHPGEAARMLSSSTADVQADRPGAATALSRKFAGAWTVLKGYQTVVGRAKGDMTINGSGNPGLAQGGSGDVLAGFLAGLLAQPGLQTDPSLTLRYAAWQHGVAADRLAQERKNWTVEDLVVALA